MGDGFEEARPLGWGRIAFGVAVCVVLFFIALYAAINRASVDPSGLPERCATSRPEWQSYQEDIKGQIGAAAAAEWHGAPVQLEIAGREARLTFRIEGPWANYPCGIPVLLRDPLGNVVQNTSVSPPSTERMYVFALPSENPPPWLEIHYPHQERRLPLTPEGTWQASDAPAGS